jgi:hypothetical protein
MERQDKYYVENNYQVTDAEVDIIEYDRKIAVEEGTIDAYNELTAFLQYADPSSTDFYANIDQRIDLDALIDYFVAQFYFANADWPVSNIEFWKFTAETSKWKLFFYDSDACMVWLNFDHIADYGQDMDDYQKFPEFSTFLLRSLLRNNQFREEFTQKYYHHLGTTFSADPVIKLINHFEKIYAPLVPEHIYRWNNPVDYTKWEENVDWLKEFAMRRPMVVAEQLQNNFGNPFIIYPNPTEGNFYVDFYGAVEPTMLKVYSIKGELLKQLQVPLNQSDPLRFGLDLPPGLYILQVTVYNMVFTSKLIIQ